jgi:hypothetical protein
VLRFEAVQTRQNRPTLDGNEILAVLLTNAIGSGGNCGGSAESNTPSIVLQTAMLQLPASEIDIAAFRPIITGLVSSDDRYD